MGMYTGYKANFQLRADTPPEVMAILQWMYNDNEDAEPIPPGHPFFLTRRWQSLFWGGSCSFEYGPGDDDLSGATLAQTPEGNWAIAFYSSTKGGTDDLYLFFEWLFPHLHVESEDYTLLGVALYEESTRPSATFMYRGVLYSERIAYRPDPNREPEWVGFSGGYGPDAFEANAEFEDTTTLPDTADWNWMLMTSTAVRYPSTEK